MRACLNRDLLDYHELLPAEFPTLIAWSGESSIELPADSPLNIEMMLWRRL
jgi:hypothetical protein